MNIFINIMFVLVMIALFVEYHMSTRWVPAYFKLGIPIYSKRLIDKAAVLSVIDEGELNKISKSIVIGFVTPLVFKKIAVGQWVLRQQSFRNAIMHGKLFVEQGSSNVRLVGFMNWSILLLLGASIIISIQHMKYYFVVPVVVIITLLYFLEKTMYDRLVKYLSKENMMEHNS